MFGGDTIRTALPEWTTGTSTEVELSSWCPNEQNPLRHNRKTGPFQIKSTALFPPCHCSHPSLVPGFPWRCSRLPPGDSSPPTVPPGSAPLRPQPAGFGRACPKCWGQRWPFEWWRRRWSRGRPSEEGKQTKVKTTNKQVNNKDANWPIDCGGWCVRGMEEMGLLPRLLCRCCPDWEAGPDWTWSGGSRSLECWWAAGETTGWGEKQSLGVIHRVRGSDAKLNVAAGHHPEMGTLKSLQRMVSCTSWHYLRGGALQAGSQRSAGLRSSEWWFHCRWRPLRSLTLRQIFKNIDFNQSDRP